MIKEFIPYEQALALKELGFDEPCFAYYNIDPQLKTPAFNIVKPFEHEWCLSAPLKQQAFRFFREKYKLHSTITSISQESWQWHIQKTGQQLGKLYNEDFYTYEEAELECLKKLIEIVKHES